MNSITAGPFNRDWIVHGVDHFVPCFMFDISSRQIKCSMWLDIHDEVGEIGFVAYEGETAIGQLFFIPKKYARKITLPFSRQMEHFDKTLVIGCLMVFGEQFGSSHWGKGAASAMISALIQFSKQKGFKRIEACVDQRSPKDAGWMTSFYPFRKFGFEIESDSFGWEGKENMRMCSLTIPESVAQRAGQ